ncbi:cytochrome c oxidase assembly protein [Ilumatobacter nonamiensis]|uniref:cytochrome c oxidase assembly protein n=1 Tax=Ilumatobacter nonamiensis TaxID=467093 RepID=UPI00034D0743|nr:cytochrome c oxidase assembly protein [Ilumatobacter nonamiensis]
MLSTLIAHTSAVDHEIIVIAGVVVVALYGVGWWRAGPISAWRLVAWCSGVTALLVSVIPAMEKLASESFAGHMVQHLLMIVVGAPLLVVANPSPPFRALRLIPQRVTTTERAVGRWWRSYGAFASAGFFVVVLYLTHLTAIYDRALGNRFVYDIEHVAYIASAIALWAALRGSARRAAPARIGSVFAVIASTALLGVVLLSASSPLVPTYETSLGFDDALDDQRAAASLMWVSGMATTLPLLLISVWTWASSEERTAVRSEALRDRGREDAHDAEPNSGEQMRRAPSPPR